MLSLSLGAYNLAPGTQIKLKKVNYQGKSLKQNLLQYIGGYLCNIVKYSGNMHDRSHSELQFMGE